MLSTNMDERDCDGACEAKNISQFAESVINFSSQYGSETSISYTVPNLAANNTIYPSDGDFTQACVFRMYGPWWKLAPSAPHTLHRTPPSFVSEDFVELKFSETVYPTKIDIYETYNPGSVVRILAADCDPDDLCTGNVRWVTLWSGANECAPASSRIFSPPIRSIPFPTRVLRLEVNHELCEYYTELDAVRLFGYPGNTLPSIPEIESVQTAPTMESEVILVDSSLDSNSVGGDDKLVGELSKLQLRDSVTGELRHSDNGFFDILPEEVIQVILSYLDHQSLCKLAATCKLIHSHCYDSLQYTDLNLQPYWTQVRDRTLEDLSTRCRHIQRLSLSWCCSYSAITNSGLTKFLLACGSDLTCLRLACCQFVNNETVKTTVKNCLNLTELDLHSNKAVDFGGFTHLTRLENLERLNLYRTCIDVHALVSVIRCCPKLTHLNIGACNIVNNFDDVAAELGRNCRNLRSIDLWRARTLSDNGLSYLANGCNRLEELDLGWCSELRSSTDCFVNLARKCPDLKKLFLTANRTVCDKDMNEIAERCPNMEQLDILGTREVSQAAAQKVLERCKNLRFFDVSFCAGTDFATVRLWRQQYPHVSIKKSFQT